MTSPQNDTPAQPEEDRLVVRRYDRPAGGWGALRSVGRTLARNGMSCGLATLPRVNQPHGVDCPGCAWPDAPRKSAIRFCEQGVKAVTHETTSRRVSADFLAAHTLREMREQSEFWLEDQGRLTEPMRYDAATDTYRPIAWSEAFTLAGAELRKLPDPEAAVFYTSGRSSNEAAFLFQLFARAFGTNNLPDSSNLCHEPSGVALRQTIGVGKGTATLADFAAADAIFIFGQNPASNHPRMMGELHRAHRRGCRIVVFNPLREAGLIKFTDPQSPVEMLTGGFEPIADAYFQVRTGGDLAALKGIVRALLEADAAALAAGRASLLDRAFIAEHTEGFAAFQHDILQESWQRIEEESGLSRARLTEAANLYAQADAVLTTWGMGLTQHEYAVSTIQMLSSLLLLRGNIGKPGAGAVPVRGHSNVQGDRTMGVTAKPSAAWLDALDREFGIESPRRNGLDALATVNGLLDGSVRAFVGLGGNFGTACPDSPRVLAAMAHCDLTVHVATKLNRSHLYPGRTGLLLPCLGRTECDMQTSGQQFVSVEDSMSMVHSSTGNNLPASERLLSEPVIVSELARHTLGETIGKRQDASIRWRWLAEDYDRIRAAIERTTTDVVKGFGDFNASVRSAHGFRLPNAAGERQWLTASGKAVFIPQPIPTDTALRRARRQHGDAVLCLMTLRSHDQYNTTVYGEDDRYRGIHGSRKVLFINPLDIGRLGLAGSGTVSLRAVAADGIPRRVTGYRLVPYDIPSGCVAGYFPELTPLASPDLKAHGADTPAVKEIPVIVERESDSDSGAGTDV